MTDQKCTCPSDDDIFHGRVVYSREPCPIHPKFLADLVPLIPSIKLGGLDYTIAPTEENSND
jgi:hypothetical protein